MSCVLFSRKIFSVAGLQWSEDLTIFVQTVVGCKVSVMVEMLNWFTVFNWLTI